MEIILIVIKIVVGIVGASCALFLIWAILYSSYFSPYAFKSRNGYFPNKFYDLVREIKEKIYSSCYVNATNIENIRWVEYKNLSYDFSDERKYFIGYFKSENSWRFCSNNVAWHGCDDDFNISITFKNQSDELIGKFKLFLGNLNVFPQEASSLRFEQEKGGYRICDYADYQDVDGNCKRGHLTMIFKSEKSFDGIFILSY